MKRYAETEEMYHEALRIFKQAMGDEHPDVANYLENIASLFVLQGQYEEAERTYREATELRKRTLPEGHPQIGMSQASLANVLLKLGRSAEAMAAAEESVGALEANLPGNHWDLARARTVLGGSLVLQGRYEEAERLLLQSERVLAEQSTVAKIRPHRVECLSELVDLYDSWGKPDKAAEYRALLEEATGGAESDVEDAAGADVGKPASDAKASAAQDAGEAPASPPNPEDGEGESP